MPLGSDNYGADELTKVLDECQPEKPPMFNSPKLEVKPEDRETKKEQISALKCGKNEYYTWNPRVYYEKTICPLCRCDGNKGPKEITTPHFRKHLEAVHSVRDILEVLVCKLCHRNSVENSVDIFLGLTTTPHQHQMDYHGGQQTEFIQVYAKRIKAQKGEVVVPWGLEGGVTKDPNKHYKYASRGRKKTEQKNSPNQPVSPSHQTQKTA